MKSVEILAIGDELLRGIVQESNAHWLSKRIAARNATLTRVTILPDDVARVADEVRAILARAPDVVVTHGGLGPTDDDRTREMLARALDVPQQTHPDALEIVRRRYAELAAAGAVDRADLTPARARMAELPVGAEPLDNQVGAAPAFHVRSGATTIIALPGVPPELFWIWEQPLAPLLDTLLGPGGFAEETVLLDLLDESAIAWLLEELQRMHPDVYVKSRARGFGAGDEVRVTLAASAGSQDAAEALIARAGADLRAALAAEGVAIQASS